MIIQYESSLEKVWDSFVLDKSYNGNFLQTRRFLNYHPTNRFKDNSLMIYKGETVVAVMPANVKNEGKMLISHEGSTFGGLIIGDDYCSTTNYKWIFDEIIAYFTKKGFKRVELRMPNKLYCRTDKNNELLDYFFQLYGFSTRKEVGFYIDLDNIEEDYERHFDSLKRRKLRKANKFGLSFRELITDSEIKQFYEVLEDNMKKFGTTPLHTYDELLEFKKSRLKEETSFYGVFLGDEMVAASMVFDFCNKKVFHTQYLASIQERLEVCPNEFLYTNLIRMAKLKGYRYLSYGTATLDHGNIYNESLGMYKEGFNTDTYVNTTYIYEPVK